MIFKLRFYKRATVTKFQRKRRKRINRKLYRDYLVKNAKVRFSCIVETRTFCLRVWMTFGVPVCQRKTRKNSGANVKCNFFDANTYFMKNVRFHAHFFSPFVFDRREPRVVAKNGHYFLAFTRVFEGRVTAWAEPLKFGKTKSEFDNKMG